MSLAVVFLFLLGLAITSGTDPDYIYHDCSNANSFTPNSTYQSNLNLLLSYLSSNSTSNNGFHNTTTGQAPDTVYGLFLCRGDLSTDVCQDCVTFATREVVQMCPLKKVALIWYDECLLHYSNLSFFNTVNEESMMILYNTQNARNQTSFNELVQSTMKGIASQASSDAKKFAAGATNLSPFNDLYTLVQCTQDLSSINCQRCLQIAVEDLQSGKIGARILGPSCHARFETYLFYNQSAVPSSPSPPVSLPPPASFKGKRQFSWQKVVVIVAAIVALVVLFIAGYCFLSRRGKNKYKKAGPDIPTVESLQFDFATIQTATRKFSYDAKLGQGSFGEVYKGALPCGQDIAVKRLSGSSRQGTEEFKNEVVVVAKLQHRSLVRLLGFCLEEEEKILVYEFVANKSLDFFLNDPEKKVQLDWSQRYNIIEGIARGILYLHHDSRLRIIHRDLKPSNILLDGDMNPKISDFGMAKVFGVGQTQGNTNRIVGTYGYMSPEYAMHGKFSVKSDIYSFGVLVLEIISGKKNNSFYQIDAFENLVTYAWKLWRAEAALQLLDPTLRDSSFSKYEVIRCIHLGLLCVQEDPTARPTMAKLVSMLDNNFVTLPPPQEPEFFLHGRVEYNSSQSTSNPFPLSVNEASVTDVQLT